MGRRLSAARDRFLDAERVRIGERRERILRTGDRLASAIERSITLSKAKLESKAQLFDSLNYKSVLKRGYALVWDAAGHPVRSPEEVADGQALTLEFAGGRAEATGGRGAARAKSTKAKTAPEDQGALF
jgi:exodeoxyribonuclease VII large subunit